MPVNGRLMEREKAKYVKNGYDRCPFCKLTTVTRAAPAAGGDKLLLVPVTCDSCRKTWTDVFTLTGVWDAEGPPDFLGGRGT